MERSILVSIEMNKGKVSIGSKYQHANEKVARDKIRLSKKKC